MNKDIRKRRIALGLSQTELTRISGVTVTTISLIELGKIRPRPETIQKIISALDGYEAAREHLLLKGGKRK